MSQKTRAALATEISTGFADNVDGAVTPAILRGIAQDIVDSAPNITDNDPLVAYSAAVPGDWAGSAPTTLKAAIDRLAAANPGA